LDAITERRGGTYRLRPVPEQEQQAAVEAVEACLSAGKRAIVIVPEADPVPATARDLVDTFGDSAALYLGGDDRQRYRMWLDIRAGRYDVVIGTRPAVFAPLPDVGLIWLCRESHALYREERSPYFHVRDVAMARSIIELAVFVMAALCHSVEAHVLDATDVSPAGRTWPPVELVRPGPEGRATRLLAALKEARRRLRFTSRDPRRLAGACRRDVIAFLADQGIDAPPSATPRELGVELERHFLVDAKPFARELAAARFGRPDDARAAVRRARRELRGLHKAMRSQLGFWRRLRGVVSLRSLAV
jgi:hypothetical protein